MSRDLPVLAAIVQWRDDNPMGIGPSFGDLAGLTGFDGVDVLRAIRTLDGTFIGVQILGGGGDLTSSFVTDVTGAARQAVGQWPSGESLVQQLVSGLRAAELSESDPVQKGRLRAAVDALSGVARDVVVDVAASVVAHSIGHV